MLTVCCLIRQSARTVKYGNLAMFGLFTSIQHHTIGKNCLGGNNLLEICDGVLLIKDMNGNAIMHYENNIISTVLIGIEPAITFIVMNDNKLAVPAL